MHFDACPIAGAWVIDPAPHADARGRFMRAWCTEEFAAHGIDFVPLQANMGFSEVRGTMRGLHFQAAPHEEAKLVRCTRGSVFDVLVDLRPGSDTHRQWFGVTLDARGGRMLYVPPLCAHGYLTLEDDSEIYYLTSALYAPSAVRGVRFDDPSVNIAWPMTPVAISEQDSRWPLLAQQKEGAAT